MSVNGVAYNYYNSNIAVAKNTKGATDKKGISSEKSNGVKELTEAEEMEIFKREFYDDLSKVISHPTVSNAAVNISESAFLAMKDDPEYREKILSLIQRDLGDSYAPRNCSVLITVGATLDEYRGDSWPVGYDSEFSMRSQNSFYKRTSDAKDKRKELLEEYLEKQTYAAQLQRNQYVSRGMRNSGRKIHAGRMAAPNPEQEAGFSVTG